MPLRRTRIIATPAISPGAVNKCCIFAKSSVAVLLARSDCCTGTSGRADIRVCKSVRRWQNAATLRSMKTAEASDTIQEFSFHAPDAQSVLLVGDFTHWQSSPISLQKGADGNWRVHVPLASGIHHYRFLVDGEWRDDSEYTVRVS